MKFAADLQWRWAQWVACLLLSCLASACATPIGVTFVDTQAAHRILTASALSTGTPSGPSLQVLNRLNLFDQFQKEPEKALATLHGGVQRAADRRGHLFALAELSFLHGEESGNRAYYLAGAVYAYALLFPENRGEELHSSDPRRPS